MFDMIGASAFSRFEICTQPRLLLAFPIILIPPSDDVQCLSFPVRLLSFAQLSIAREELLLYSILNVLA
jgi:hypothetical protein